MDGITERAQQHFLEVRLRERLAYLRASAEWYEQRRVAAANDFRSFEDATRYTAPWAGLRDETLAVIRELEQLLEPPTEPMWDFAASESELRLMAGDR